MQDSTQPITTKDRQRWMAVLAKSPAATVVSCWKALGLAPAFTYLRPAETGLVMTRGRISGTGDAFNLGEMTVTRCSLRLEDGTVGHAYVAGRSKDHAQAAALVDALMQGKQRTSLDEKIITPLETALRHKRETHARKAAATKVDFFTMARSSKPK